jgi:spore coat protein U-like protein
MRISALAPIAAGAALMAAGAANAAVDTTTFTVSAFVNANCLVSANNLNFGNYNGAGADRDVDSTIAVRCSNGTAYTVKLSTGGGTFAQREMTAGTNKLQYNLYTTSARNTIWGDNTSGTGIQPGAGQGMSSGKAITHTVYGRLPSNAFNQDAPGGTYSDTITVTVEY